MVATVRVENWERGFGLRMWTASMRKVFCGGYIGKQVSGGMPLQGPEGEWRKKDEYQRLLEFESESGDVRFWAVFWPSPSAAPCDERQAECILEQLLAEKAGPFA